MKIYRTTLSGVAALAAIGAFLALGPESAAQNLYDGKRITIITGGTPGAGLDSYVRLVARHYTRHIPG